jgi:hypothetical protein
VRHSLSYSLRRLYHLPSNLKWALLVVFLVAASDIAQAADCPEQRASEKLPYRSGGIVPTGFITPSDGKQVVHGVDVSKYQEEVNFDGVSLCGGSFAYIRLSAGANPDNELSYRTLWAGAKSAGLLTGPYHYLILVDSKVPMSKLSASDTESLQATNVQQARQQAQLFKIRLTELLSYDPLEEQKRGAFGAPYLPVVLALTARPQLTGSATDQQRYGPIYTAAICEWIKEFQSDPQFRDQPVILFTKPLIYKDFQLSSAKCDLTRLKVWVSYNGRTGDSAFTEKEPAQRAAIEQLCRNPEGDNRCILEQYTPFGGFAVYKVGGGLDLDRFFGTKASLEALLQSASPGP